ncbi:MAG: thermonuclease family protein [Candidatus Omnitrophota bacterium]
MRNIVRLGWLFVMVFFLGVSYAAAPCPGKGGIFSSPAKKYDYDSILVKRAVDGDTVLLENGDRVRLIGIDTPECHESQKLYRDSRRTKQDVSTIKEMGKKAAAFTKKLVEGKKVRLEFDVERKDKYGRLLAYLYLPDGTFVNAEIVANGFASLMTIPPNVKYSEQLRACYKDARENRRGLWKN